MSLYAIKSAKIRHRILSPQVALVGQRSIAIADVRGGAIVRLVRNWPERRTSAGALHAGMATMTHHRLTSMLRQSTMPSFVGATGVRRWPVHM